MGFNNLVQNYIKTKIYLKEKKKSKIIKEKV